jgi:hypothetical protein
LNIANFVALPDVEYVKKLVEAFVPSAISSLGWTVVIGIVWKAASTLSALRTETTVELKNINGHITEIKANLIPTIQDGLEEVRKDLTNHLIQSRDVKTPVNRRTH